VAVLPRRLPFQNKTIMSKDMDFFDSLHELARMQKSFIDRNMPEVETFEFRTYKHDYLGLCAVVRVGRYGLNNSLSFEFTQLKEQSQYRDKDKLSNTSKIGILQQFIRIENK
jgi:hypothetical protein